MKDIDEKAEDYLSNVKGEPLLPNFGSFWSYTRMLYHLGMSNDKRKSHLEEIKKLFVKSKGFGDDKVQLAMQTYEMVPTDHKILLHEWNIHKTQNFF